MSEATNVLGGPLQMCCANPITGFYRDGKCKTGAGDWGVHIICAQMTTEFLAYTKGQGNDLSTPMPLYAFPGLQAGDHWCLCASRWQQALQAGCSAFQFSW
ncbi:MAG: DUF2237 domain-containing protein [Acaryochloridaceae cyanobacterium SU_2_1]|nr:DUF2237 domain-containing protein [Acaryochloridaceae cyanobacterium SU_2_1]